MWATVDILGKRLDLVKLVGSVNKDSRGVDLNYVLYITRNLHPHTVGYELSTAKGDRQGLVSGPRT